MRKTKGEGKANAGPAPKRLAAFCAAHPQYKQGWVAAQVKASVEAAIDKAELDALLVIDPQWVPPSVPATEAPAP